MRVALRNGSSREREPKLCVGGMLCVLVRVLLLGLPAGAPGDSLWATALVCDVVCKRAVFGVCFAFVVKKTDKS